MNTIKIISDDDVKSILDLKNAILCVENAYREKANNRATVLPLVSADLVHGKADMDIKSGIYQAGNLFGLKLVAWFGDNKLQGLPDLTAMTMVFDLKNGMPIALLNAGYLTAMRTGAAGAVGIKYLAKQNAEVLTLVGTGNQAAYQIAAALAAVPTIRKVYLYNPRNEEKAHLLKQSIRTKLGEMKNSCNDIKNETWIRRINTVEFCAANDIQSALEETDAVITITPSSQALIKKEWVKPGTHISCIGADLPGKRELDETLFRTARIFADDIVQASSVGELQTAVRSGIVPIESIKEIGGVINGNETGRLSNNDITIFDSTGIALQDLAVADYIIKTAKEKNIGTNVTI